MKTLPAAERIAVFTENAVNLAAGEAEIVSTLLAGALTQEKNELTPQPQGVTVAEARTMDTVLLKDSKPRELIKARKLSHFEVGLLQPVSSERDFASVVRGTIGACEEVGEGFINYGGGLMLSSSTENLESSYGGLIGVIGGGYHLIHSPISPSVNRVRVHRRYRVLMVGHRAARLVLTCLLGATTTSAQAFEPARATAPGVEPARATAPGVVSGSVLNVLDPPCASAGGRPTPEAAEHAEREIHFTAELVLMLTVPTLSEVRRRALERAVALGDSQRELCRGLTGEIRSPPQTSPAPRSNPSGGDEPLRETVLFRGWHAAASGRAQEARAAFEHLTATGVSDAAGFVALLALAELDEAADLLFSAAQRYRRVAEGGSGALSAFAHFRLSALAESLGDEAGARSHADLARSRLPVGTRLGQFLQSRLPVSGQAPSSSGP
ncbi:MAG: hypothetical protein EXR76_12795 [Myxococcales bacterium]|nr:hypothetical protein [Myxococcales bacterium]